MAPDRAIPNAFELKITLKGIRPPIWRRVQVPAGMTLDELHKVIQVVMGWENYHLHQYIFRGRYYGDPINDEFGDLGLNDERDVSLKDLFAEAGYKPGFKLLYEYDFGDGWEHEIKVEKALQLEKRLRRPVCIGGKRACPPEDVGGFYGYSEFLRAISDPQHKDHESYLEWIGGEFDPEEFDLREVDLRLKYIDSDLLLDESAELILDPTGESLQNSLTSWMNELDHEQTAWAENLALRKNMIAILQYLQENRVIGTSARGNFPLKAVRGIAANFVNSPELDTTIGSHTFKLRTEEDVWPLHWLHIVGVVNGLLEGGISQRWLVTPTGEVFLQLPAPAQAWMLFTSWWLSMNWIFMLPYRPVDTLTPEGYKDNSREALLRLPVSQRVEFEPFAASLIEATHLHWPTASPLEARSLMNSFVRNTLIKPLVDFDLIVPEHQVREERFGLKELVAFQVKPVGRRLLETLTMIKRPR